MFFTLFEPYLKKYLVFFKKKKMASRYYNDLHVYFFFLTNIHYFFICGRFNFFKGFELSEVE